MGIFGLIVLGAFGFACAQSAWKDRQTGWGYGLAFGAALILAGWGGLAYWFITLMTS